MTRFAVDDEDWMLPREPVKDWLTNHIDQRMQKSFPRFQERHWTIGDAARWIIGRSPDAVDDLTINMEQLLEVLPEMQSAFARGDVSVVGCTRNDPIPRELPSETWSVYQLIVEELNGLVQILPAHASATGPDHTLFSLRLHREEVLLQWPGLSDQSQSTEVLPDPDRPKTVAAEHLCQRWLSELMKIGPPQPKASVRAQAFTTFPNLSKRGFDRAWDRAIEKTGADAWRAPGRRRREIESPH